MIYNSSIRSKLDDAIRMWKEVTTTLDLQIGDEQKQEINLPDMDPDEFLDMLYLTKWVSDSESDIGPLTDASIPQENILVSCLRVMLLIMRRIIYWISMFSVWNLTLMLICQTICTLSCNSL